MLAYALALQGVLLALGGAMHVQAAGLPRAVLCFRPMRGSSHQPGRPKGRSRALLYCRLRPPPRGRDRCRPSARSGAPSRADRYRALAQHRALASFVQRPAGRFARTAALRLIFEIRVHLQSTNRTAHHEDSFAAGALVATGFSLFPHPLWPMCRSRPTGDPEQHLQGGPSHPPWLRRRADPQGQRAHPRRRDRGQADAQGRVDSRMARRKTYPKPVQ